MKAIKNTLFAIFYIVLACVAIPVLTMGVAMFAVLCGAPVDFWTDVFMFAGEHSFLALFF